MSNAWAHLASVKYFTAQGFAYREHGRDGSQPAVHLPVISKGFSLTARDFIFNCLTQCLSDDWEHLAAD